VALIEPRRGLAALTLRGRGAGEEDDGPGDGERSKQGVPHSLPPHRPAAPHGAEPPASQERPRSTARGRVAPRHSYETELAEGMPAWEAGLRVAWGGAKPGTRRPGPRAIQSGGVQPRAAPRRYSPPTVRGCGRAVPRSAVGRPRGGRWLAGASGALA